MKLGNVCSVSQTPMITGAARLLRAAQMPMGTPMSTHSTVALVTR